MSRRQFSTGNLLKKLLSWKLNGTTDEIGWAQTNVEAVIDHVPSLAKKATGATIEGNPHETRQRDGKVDPYHASGTILSKSGRHLTSFHAYENGQVRFSKDKYNAQAVNAGENARPQASSSLKTGLNWEMSADNTCALWWDGTQWREGEWSHEAGKWVAFHNGEWVAWEC